MNQRNFAILPERAILAVEGDDRRPFLQGLISNDIEHCTPTRAIHAALLSAQGRYLHDFFIAELGGKLLLETEAARLADLNKKLTLYKLRSKITLTDLSDSFDVAVIWDGVRDNSDPDKRVGAVPDPFLNLPPEPGAAIELAGGVVYTDPRLPELGARALLPKGKAVAALSAAGLRQGDVAEWDRLRLTLGVPDGSRDLPVEKALLLENGFDELHGVDWNKGCYMGQELTARMKYRALIRKRLVPVTIDGPLPAPGTKIMAGDQEAGEMRSGRDGVGLALMRLEAIDQTLTAGGAQVKPVMPSWLRLPKNQT